MPEPVDIENVARAAERTAESVARGREFFASQFTAEELASPEIRVQLATQESREIEWRRFATEIRSA